MTFCYFFGGNECPSVFVGDRLADAPSAMDIDELTVTRGPGIPALRAGRRGFWEGAGHGQ